MPFLAQGHTMEVSCSETFGQKLLDRSLANFIKIHVLPQKLFNHFQGQTDTETLVQTHAVQFIYGWVKIL